MPCRGFPATAAPALAKSGREDKDRRGYSHRRHCHWEQGTFPSGTGLKDSACAFYGNGWSSTCHPMSVGSHRLHQERAVLPGLLTFLILQTKKKKKKCCWRFWVRI